MPIQDLLSQLLGLTSLLFSMGAIFIALAISRADRATSNSWETYQEFQSPNVRRGRELTLRIKRETNSKGFDTYEDYKRYFELDKDPESAHAKQRQYLHDLAAFYHQTGALLLRRGLDRDFTLLLVGPGLDDRWPIFKSVASFYEEDSRDGDFPYGGIYLLHDMYLTWKSSKWVRLRLRFTGARKRINRFYQRRQAQLAKQSSRPAGVAQ